MRDYSSTKWLDEIHAEGVEVKKSCCYFCHQNCGVLAYVKDGKLIYAEGDPDHPTNAGGLCTRGNQAYTFVDNPSRINYPMKRAGEKGENKWERVSWDQALTEIAAKINQIKEESGAEAVAAAAGTLRTDDWARRRFLNLFAYTGTATCYAADGGVEETVTVDLSNTYLDWAERNMRQNGFVGPQHHFVRDDVLAWIRDQRQTRNRWDLIFVDPPTFSNSSKMGHHTWDVQRDHVELLAGVSRLLAQGGHAIFSCNLRGFRPETRKLARAGVVLEDITAQTIPEDFARNQKVHHCYIVRRLPIEDAMAEVGFSAEEIAERVEELRNPEARKPRAAAPAHAQAGDRGPRGNGKPDSAGKPKKKKFYASKPKSK